MQSTRFWALLALALAIYLNDQNLISDNLASFIFTVGAGHIGIRTVDRFGEKIGEQPSPIAISNKPEGDVNLTVSSEKAKQ